MAGSHDDRPGTRPRFGALVAAAVVVPAALAGLTALWPRPGVEAGLTTAAQESLRAAGIPAAVGFSGRDATVTGVTGTDGDRALAVVSGVTGVRVARLDAAGTGSPASLVVSRDGEDVVLAGTAGSDGERTALLAAASAAAEGRAVTDRITVTPGSALPAGVDAAAVGSLVGLLAGTTGDGLSATVEGGTATLSGRVADEQVAETVAGALAAALPGAEVDNRLTVGSGLPAGDELDAAARQAVADRITAATPVTFAPDTAELTPEGAAALAQVLSVLREQPAARVRVDGYVATNRGDGLLTAVQLSEQRATTVRQILVDGGVPVDRITARGLGEGDRPAADAAGRRVEIVLV